MRRFIIWVILEYKRAVKILPFLLIEAIVLILFIGTIAFCTQKIEENKNQTEEKMIIAYATEDKNKLMDLALSYVESMESVKDIYEFVQVDLEQGKTMLAKGEAIAFIVLPENIVEGILDGKNPPAIIYLPKNISPIGHVFEVIVDSGIGMLQIAQAEVYAANDICVNYNGYDSISDMLYDINIFNINLVFYRENLFKIKSVSATENLPIINYYCAAGMVLYLLFVGLSFCLYFQRTSKECEKQLEVRGISFSLQGIGKLLVIFSLLLISSIIPVLLALIFHQLDMIHITLTFSKIIGGMLCLVATAEVILFLYMVMKSTKGAMLCLGFLSIVSCFFSGVFIPSALLPIKIRSIGEWLPTTWMKHIWLSWFQESEVIHVFLWKLVIFILLSFGILHLVPFILSRQKGAN